MRKKIVPKGRENFTGLFSLGIRANNLIFVSGTVGIDETGKLVGKGDTKAQALQAFENIKAVLEAEGSEPKDIVKLTTYIKNIEDYAQLNEARAEFFNNNSITEENYPASTAVEAKLVSPDFLVEIEAVALVE